MVVIDDHDAYSGSREILTSKSVNLLTSVVSSSLPGTIPSKVDMDAWCVVREE